MGTFLSGTGLSHKIHPHIGGRRSCGAVTPSGVMSDHPGSPEPSPPEDVLYPYYSSALSAPLRFQICVDLCPSVVPPEHPGSPEPSPPGDVLYPYHTSALSAPLRFQICVNLCPSVVPPDPFQLARAEPSRKHCTSARLHASDALKHSHHHGGRRSCGAAMPDSGARAFGLH